MGRTVGLLRPVLGLDGDLVGQFLMQFEEQLFARDLGRQQARRHVGNFVLGIQPRPLGHGGGEYLGQVGNAVARVGGNHEAIGEDTCIH